MATWQMTQGPARAKLSAREAVDQDALTRMRQSGALVVDDGRLRPLYFDGRFLAARDLTRDQQYFLARQADLGKAGGAGVVHGLMVSASADGTQLTIGAGHGVTAAGEAVILPQPLVVPTANVVAVQQLDRAFGILQRPADLARKRTGLYLVCLRPVEYSANPIASYPSSITEPRTVEDGDIVDAVAASLVPYADDGTAADTGARRARVARDLFVAGASTGLTDRVLPLAMVLLDNGIVRWLDVFMVRREVGSSHGDVLGFGFAPRATREAHLVQYDQHLTDVVRDRDRANRGQRFAATEHFAALPPSGRLPAAAVNPADFTQGFFPPEVDVDLSIIPEDELPALLEESLLLPPIDLTMSGEALESTAVTILCPVPREHLRAVRQALATPVPPVRALRAAAPGLIARRRPLEMLQGLRLPRVIEPPLLPVPPADVAWRQVLGAAAQSAGGFLWYARRRDLQSRSDVVGQGVRVLPTNEYAPQQALEGVLGEHALLARYQALRTAATAAAGAELVELLASPKLAGSRFLLTVALRELELARHPLTAGASDTHLLAADVAAVAERYDVAGLGDGIGQLETAIAAKAAGAVFDTVANAVAQARVVADVDRIGDRRRGDATALDDFATRLVAEAQAHGADGVKQLVAETLQEG